MSKKRQSPKDGAQRKRDKGRKLARPAGGGAIWQAGEGCPVTLKDWAEHLGERYDAGDGLAAIEAASFAIGQCDILPKRVREDAQRAMSMYLAGVDPSLDDAFKRWCGAERGRLDAYRRQQGIAQVYLWVEYELDDQPIDVALANVAERANGLRWCNVTWSITTVNQAYYSVKRQLPERHPKIKPS